MKHRLQSIGALALIIVACAAFSCSSSQRQQVAQAAENAAIVVKGFQQGEIVAHELGEIPADDHAFIQQSLIAVAQSGKTLDGCVRTSGSNAGVIACVNSAVATIDEVNRDGALHLKSERARTDFALAMVGTRTALAVIVTVMGGAQ